MLFGFEKRYICFCCGWCGCAKTEWGFDEMISRKVCIQNKCRYWWGYGKLKKKDFVIKSNNSLIGTKTALDRCRLKKVSGDGDPYTAFLKCEWVYSLTAWICLHSSVLLFWLRICFLFGCKRLLKLDRKIECVFALLKMPIDLLNSCEISVCLTLIK